MELPIVSVALLAAVAAGVVAEIELPAPLISAIRTRAVGREAAEERNITWLHFQQHPGRQVDLLFRELVVFSVAR